MSREMGSSTSDNRPGRFIWTAGEKQEAPEALDRPESAVDDELKLWDAKSWICSVMAISRAEGEPITDPHYYGALLNKTPNCAMWAASCELNPDGIPHVHTLALTGQRSDAYKRSVAAIWENIKGTINLDIEHDDNLDVLKCQKCHRPSSMIPYMVKQPLWYMTNSTRLLGTLDDCVRYQKGSRFIKDTKGETSNMNLMTQEITQVIMTHGCKTVEDCVKRAPEIMAKYIHRGAFQTVVSNCLMFVKATAGTWSLGLYIRQSPNPEAIHKILLTQGICPEDWDLCFHEWITKKSPKRNTFVLWGPSNCGKSALISGLKSCVAWGEIVNSNTFAFEGLLENTIGVWEEPLISPELAEKAKQIFEGMETAVPIKYKKPIKLPRIPIIITTNHAPWRFCTNEEPMFRNRMYIWRFNHTMTDPVFVPRASGSGCECRYCGKCSVSSPTPGSPTIGAVSSGEQSLPEQLVSRDGAQTSDVGGGSLPSSGGSAQWGYNRESPSRGRGESEQCTDGTRPSVSSGSSTELNLYRSSGKSGPGNSDFGIPGSESGSLQYVESDRYRGDDVHDSGPDRKRRRADGRPGDREYTESSRAENEASSHVGSVLGGSATAENEIQIQTKESEVGGSVDPITVPTPDEWKMYFAFLQNKYGN